MTDETRARLIEAKEGVSERLRKLDIPSYGLCATDERLERYTREVADNPESHNLWEQLAVEQFFKKIDRYGLDTRSVKQFFFFYESLFFDGKKGLQRYRLTPIQCFQFASVYGFYTQEGKRVVKECCLYVPRKFSKTTSTASFALYDLLFGENNAEVYIGANSQMQAKRCFDVIRKALLKLDNRGKRYVINQEEVRARKNSPRQSSARCLTANARTKDGMNASTVIMDEFSQARDSNLLTVLTTSMGVRDNPLTVIITTASDVFEGPFYSILQGYKSILLGDYEDDTVFCHLFEPDVSDAEDDPRTWMKVHPHIGVTVPLKYYHEEYAKALRNGAEAMLAFRTKLLNVYTENEQKSWISGEQIKAHTKKFDIRRLSLTGDKLPATIGVDLSVRGDFSAITFGVYIEGEGVFYFHTDYFFPRGALPGHRNEHLYRKWASEGHLTLLEGEVIDNEALVEHILQYSEYLEILAICYDPAKSKDFINMLGATRLGGVLKPFRQTNFYFTAPVQSMEIAVYTHHVWFDENPITPYCFSNTVLLTDNMGNMKPYKRTQEGKIDGVITALMSMAAYSDLVRYFF